MLHHLLSLLLPPPPPPPPTPRTTWKAVTVLHPLSGGATVPSAAERPCARPVRAPPSMAWPVATALRRLTAFESGDAPAAVQTQPSLEVPSPALGTVSEPAERHARSVLARRGSPTPRIHPI
ncbi:hypothetical protein PVAP13_6NG016632 [Panicum virgatum]|uniref:Uncharacterized protein n=1 Tax=Panicum virgatum TaxID=38727 RepID=A0A8T0QSV5_PANVG|nr:hypothetical protein PVAP13_6NG016632 [Panicum virgatum]